MALEWWARREGVVLPGRVPLVLLALLVAGCRGVTGQERPLPTTGPGWMANVPALATSEVTLSWQEVRPPQPGVWKPIVGGLVPGAAGFGVGVAIRESSSGSGASFVPIFAPVLVESIGVALGTHLGNGRRGSVAGDLLVSVLGGGLAYALDEAMTTGGAGEGHDFLWALPVQVVGVVLTERITGRD